MDAQFDETTITWQDLQQEVANELDETHRMLKDVGRMLEQSKAEMARLTQRNQALTGRLQQIWSQMETVPRADIRRVYDEALDAQQRLLVMRGQLEKLQTDQASAQRFAAFLEKIQSGLKSTSIADHNSKSNTTGVVEMVVNAQESVRQRLSTQMHDGPAQALSNFILRMDIAARLLEIDPNRAKEELAELKVEASKTFNKLKGFIGELRPMMLDDLGLAPTLRRYIESFKQQNSVEASLAVKGQERRLESYVEVMVFRAVQEMMGNAVRHNPDMQGRLTVNVLLSLEENQVRAIVTDNGHGFDAKKIDESGKLGLKLLRERVEMMGGYLEIESGVGQGCKVGLTVPCLERAN